MSDYTLTELTELAKFRSDRNDEALDYDQELSVSWDDLTEMQKLAEIVSVDKLLDEIEARKKPLEFKYDLTTFRADHRVYPNYIFNVDNPVSSDNAYTIDALQALRSEMALPKYSSGYQCDTLVYEPATELRFELGGHKPDPRVWNLVQSIPEGVTVKDREGDFFRVNGLRELEFKYAWSGWSEWEDTTDEANTFAPFTEVLNG